MRIYTFLSIAFLLIGLRVSGQSASLKGDTLILHMKTVQGVGPKGPRAIGISYRKDTLTEEEKAIPLLKDLPASLSQIKQYTYLVQPFQFYYQNFRAGVFSKEIFFQQAKKRNWVLADTMYLSAKPIRCYASLINGYNASHTLMYVLDANNNGSLADDVPKVLAAPGFHEKPIQDSVAIDHLVDGQMRTERLPIGFEEGRGKDPQYLVSIRFPVFRYCKWAYENQTYLIATEPFYSYGLPDVYVLPDEPVFDRVNDDKRVQLHQYARFGNSYFRFIRFLENGNKIVFVQTRKVGEAVAQVGWKAPRVQGVVLDESTYISKIIDTEKLKGKYVFIDFWSTTCAPCIAEFPNLKEVYQTFDRSQLELIGVIDERGKGSAKKLLEKHAIPWPNIQTEVKGTVMEGYEIERYPTSFLLDPDGKIIAMNLREKQLLNMLNTLLKPR